MKEIGGEAPSYIEGNPSTAFAARLIPQYESHIRVTKETIQFVVNVIKEIPHSNCVTKERTPKLSQHVSHQGTVRSYMHAFPFSRTLFNLLWQVDSNKACPDTAGLYYSIHLPHRVPIRFFLTLADICLLRYQPFSPC